MSTFAAPVEVCNAALAEVGHDQIESLLDGSPAAITFNTVYELLVKAELTKPGYSFATTTDRLVLQGATGNSPAYAYYLPSGILRPKFLMVGNRRARGYIIRSSKLLVDVQAEYDLTYTFRAPESEWSPGFSNGMKQRLMAVFMRSIAVDWPAAREMDQVADLTFMIERGQDRSSQTKPPTGFDPVLVRAWRGASTNAQA